MNYVFRLLLVIGVLLTSCLFFNKIYGQSSGINGVWKLDSINVKKDISDIKEGKYSSENLPEQLKFDCPIIINTQQDDTSISMSNEMIYKPITFLLENNKLTISLFPGHLSTYDIEIIDNKLNLIDLTKGIECIFINVTE